LNPVDVIPGHDVGVKFDVSFTFLLRTTQDYFSEVDVKTES
jgi:hypothetical protein